MFDYLEKCLSKEYSFIILFNEIEIFIKKNFMLHYNYWEKLFVKNCLASEKVRYEEINIAPTLFFLICQISINFSLPLLFSTFPIHSPTISLPYFSLPYLLVIPNFVFPLFLASFPLNLHVSLAILFLPTFLFLTFPFLLFPFPTYLLPSLSPSLPTYPFFFPFLWVCNFFPTPH